MKLKSAFAALPMILFAGAAMAGSDTTFDGIVSTLIGWLEGDLGTLMAVSALAVGLGIGIARATAVPAVVGLVVALFANYGPSVLQGIATATI